MKQFNFFLQVGARTREIDIDRDGTVSGYWLCFVAAVCVIFQQQEK